MLNKDQHIDRIYKEAFSNMEDATPPSFIWDNINAELSSQRRIKRQLFIWRSVAAVASILFITSLFLFTISQSPTKQLAVNDAMTSEPIKTMKAKNADHISMSHNEMVIHSKIENKKDISKQESPNEQSSLKSTQTTAHNKTYNSESKNVVTNTAHRPEDFSKLTAQNINSIDLTNDINYLANKKIEKKKAKKTYYPLYYTQDKPSKNNHQIAIGGAVSPSYNYREASYDGVQSNYDEAGVTSMGGGFNVRLKGVKRWSFESGVLYSKIGQESNRDPIIDQEYDRVSFSGLLPKGQAAPLVKAQNSMGTITVQETVNTQATSSDLWRAPAYQTPKQITNISQSLDYIEVPLLARYAIYTGQPSINILGGVSTNFLINNQATTTDNYNEVSISETENINPIAISSSIGLGFEMPLNKTISFSIEPRFKYYLNSISTNDQVTFKPYSLGVFGGIIINL